KARYSGPLLWLDLAIRMEANMTIIQAHEIGLKVADAIKDQVDNVDRVIVHFDACTCRQESAADFKCAGASDHCGL
ncbi:MAG TPA: hypothetical protein DIT32_04545, partial [Peptococcaceae bacterium]|nr:hypothetical protein [Peptococcaceae bacterium]